MAPIAKRFSQIIPLPIRKTLKKNLRNCSYYVEGKILSNFLIPQQNLIVSGFWRSGTTWLQQNLAFMLRAKTIFEPFEPRVLRARGILIDGQAPSDDSPFLYPYFPFVGNDLSSFPELYSLIKDGLNAQIPGEWVRYCRIGPTDMFLRRIVLKLVRGPLCLAAIQNAFAIPVVHVYRDPRAIIASLRRSDWGRKLEEAISLKQQLLDPKDGRATFFSRWADDIIELDKASSVERIVGYWALSEIFVPSSCSNSTAPFVLVRYEDLLVDELASLHNILEQTGLAGLSHELLPYEGDSKTTSKQRLGASIETRLYGWKRELNKNDIRLIEDVTSRFGLENRLFN